MDERIQKFKKLQVTVKDEELKQAIEKKIEKILNKETVKK
jgi:predicted component of type VI protein secretion system